MSSCKICGDIEPQVHDESWWRCSCHSEIPKINIDDVMARLFPKEGEE